MAFSREHVYDNEQNCVIQVTYWDAKCFFNVKHQILNEGNFIKSENNLYSYTNKEKKKWNICNKESKLYDKIISE